MLGDLTNVTSGFSAAFNQYGPIMLNGVKSEFTKDDLTVGNLEGPLTSNPQTAWVDKSGGTAIPGSSRNYYWVHGKTEYSDILSNGDIEVVNLANNHTSDYGSDALEETKNTLQGNGIEILAVKKNYYYRKLTALKLA